MERERPVTMPTMQEIMTAFVGVVVFGTFAKIGYDWLKPKPIPKAGNGFMTYDDISKVLAAHREHCQQLLRAEFQQSIIRMESSRASGNIRIKHMEDAVNGLSLRIDEVIKICKGDS